MGPSAFAAALEDQLKARRKREKGLAQRIIAAITPAAAIPIIILDVVLGLVVLAIPLVFIYFVMFARH